MSEASALEAVQKVITSAGAMWEDQGPTSASPHEGGHMAPRAFISFEMEDRWARDFLVQQAHDKRNDIQFVDYSVQDPFDSAWKTQCRERIARTRGTIVLIGQTTYRAEAVLWEIAESNRQEHYIFGIQINRDSTHLIPNGLPAANVIRWDFDQIVKWLDTWV